MDTSTPRAPISSREEVAWTALTSADASRIVDLERRCFIGPLQASEATIRRRFELVHTMLGGTLDGQLVAMIAFCLADIDPFQKETYPASETEFCLQPQAAAPRCLVVYNLEVDPAHRRQDLPLQLLQEAMRRAKSLGIRHSIGNARIPTYSGSDPATSQERFPMVPAVRQAVDRLLTSESPADQADLLLDPVLHLYHRLTGCDFIQALADYAPADLASGGHRVIVYRDLQAWTPV